MKLENQFCFAVYACAREITKLYHPLLKDLNLTYTQYITLLALWERDAVTVKELGERLYLDSGTLTPLLKKLEAAGYLTRTRDPVDERSVRIVLTEQGRALKAKACTIPERLYLQSGMSAEQLEAIRSQMTDMLARIHRGGDSQPLA
ncbi:MarR family winged helix-turn-helix transcriptional regulator [Cohnella thailandensis]|uniref:MarR family transcriptional regulator n=1 Tax=Cohnella thailandensis TaxID=557557 RepID=A0A841SX26_9BACL|nr:MarR family transcriptional regulator [Cohnella thailandensis]MBB6635479.1 MarR family transcriptional regulator [Cohnella thailandensis]